MSQLFRIYRHGLLVGLRDFAGFWTWRSWIGGWMLRILTNVMIWVLMGRLLGSPAKLQYLLIGNAAAAGLGTFALPAATWDRMDGTYPLMVIAPSSQIPAVLGRMSVWMFGWIASSLLTFAILFAAFSIPVTALGLIAIIGVVPLLCLSTLFLSAFFGALAAMAPRYRNILAWALIFITSAICGVSVPVTFWPGWVQVIANLMPVTHGLQGLRLALAGGDGGQILRQVGLEAAVGLGWLSLAAISFDRMAEMGRADGSIEFA